MKKVFHLETCKTCQKVINALDLESKDIELQNIKEKHISAEELDELKDIVGSYEALFNKRAMKYRSKGLNKQELSESDFRKHILDEYTFLKRPAIVVGDQAFLGSSKKAVEGAREALEN